MKVWIENSDKNSNQLKGKALFCNRLGTALKKKGVEVIADPSVKTDISINVIRLKHHNSKIRILRLDGVWHDTAKKFKEKNKNIAQSLHRANGVVYQSHFSRRMGDRYLGEAKVPTVVIPNGSDAYYYEKIKPAKLRQKNIVIAFSKWRPHKRLRDIIMSFMLADIQDGILIIAGDLSRSGLSKIEIESYTKHPSIHYVGNLPQKKLASFLIAAKASIHLCWFDSCPNSVVEAIVAGVPVVCNNVGGTWELVMPSGGYICAIDTPYDMRPVDLYRPPKIDKGKVAEQLIKCIKEEPKVNKEHVLIENIANQYLKFMMELI